MTRDDLGGETEVWVESGELSASDRGLLYGDGVFESFRCYDDGVAFVDRHLDRLQRALDAVGIEEDVTEGRVTEAVDRLTGRFDADDAYLRVTVTRGAREGLLDPTESEATVIWHAKPLTRRRYPAAEVETTQVQRPTGVAGRHKTLNYLQNVQARRGSDADEALMPDSSGAVASGSVSNVFTVDGEAVATPDRDVRRGVTREIVLEVARDLGLDAREGPVDVEWADEAFLTNTSWGVRPVESVDGRVIPDDQVTMELQEAYLERAMESASQR